MPKWAGGSAHKPIEGPDGWRSQWQRVERWYKRVERAKKKQDIQPLDQNDLDDVFAFFQNCYHLRDWMKNSQPKLNKELNELFRTSPVLATCRDLCNGLKHFSITRNARDSDFNVFFEWDPFLEVERGQPIRIYVRNGIEKWELFDLTNKCRSSWVDFSRRNQLLV